MGMNFVLQPVEYVRMIEVQAKMRSSAREPGKCLHSATFICVVLLTLYLFTKEDL